MVGNFSNSTLACDNLHRFQVQNDRSKQKLVQGVPMRWNSTFLVLDCLFAESTLAMPAMMVLEQSDYHHLKLSGTQWDLARQAADVFWLQKATTALSMEQHLNMAFVYSGVHGLIKEHLQPKNEDVATIFVLKAAIVKDLKMRLPMAGTPQDAQKNLAWMVSALALRFKTLDFHPALLQHVWVEVKCCVDSIKPKGSSPKQLAFQ